MRKLTEILGSFFHHKAAFILLFLLAPFLAYFEVLLLDYTIAFNEASTDSSRRFGKLLPVLDPTAGSLQDHPWLFKIGSSLRQGVIPLINLDNGLGGFLVESLQSGVFYPLNVLLIFMDLSSPQFFDVFAVLHLLILAINCFLLFRLYVKWELALITATAFALSPLAFLNINMVHYRAFVWAPLIAWAAVSIARQRYSKSTILVATGAIICCITAGNPQESFFDILVVIVLFVAEIIATFLDSRNRNSINNSQVYPSETYTSDRYLSNSNLTQTSETLTKSRQISWKSFLVFGLSLIGGCSISSMAVLPYLVSKSQGLLNTVEDPVRSTSLISPQWLMGWVVQHINGSYGNYYRERISSYDEYGTFAIHPLFIFLAIAGIFAIGQRKPINLGSKALFTIVLVTGLLGISSISTFSPFQTIIAHIPFVNGIRITKYISYIHLLVATSGVISLSWLVAMPFKDRKQITLSTLICFVLLVLSIVLFQVLDPSWKFNLKLFDQILLAWIGSGLAVLACVYLLLKQRPPLGWKSVLVMLIIAGLLIKPFGFHNSFKHYSPFPVPELDLTKERIFSFADMPNVNILRGYERVEIFDPILNKAFAESMINNFPVLLNSGLHLQPPKETILNAKQIDLLRLMGVTSIYGYKVEKNPHLEPINESFLRVKDSLPQIFLLNSLEQIELKQIEASCQKQDHAKTLELIQAAMISQPLRGVHKGVNEISFMLENSGKGTLVALQAFSSGWKLKNAPASKFCNVFNAWEGEFKAGQSYRIHYVPPGLRTAYGVALVGILLVLISMKLSRP